jgi:hypothetical protein
MSVSSGWRTKKQSWCHSGQINSLELHSEPSPALYTELRPLYTMWMKQAQREAMARFAQAHERNRKKVV